MKERNLVLNRSGMLEIREVVKEQIVSVDEVTLSDITAVVFDSDGGPKKSRAGIATTCFWLLSRTCDAQLYFACDTVEQCTSWVETLREYSLIVSSARVHVLDRIDNPRGGYVAPLCGIALQITFTKLFGVFQQWY